VALKGDALILDGKKVLLKDIESAERAVAIPPMAWTANRDLDMRPIRIRHDQTEQYILLDPGKNKTDKATTGHISVMGLRYPMKYHYNEVDIRNRFMENLATHMENAGIRIEKVMKEKMFGWDDTYLLKIINLDLQKNH
jgi:hypothetical protein